MDEKRGDDLGDWSEGLMSDLAERGRATLGKPMEERRRDAVRSKGGVMRRCVRFAKKLVDESPGPLVFLERDALPLKALVDHIAKRAGKLLVTQALPLTRAMLPETIQNLTGDFGERHAGIRSFLASAAKDQTPLHRFITQELAGKNAAMIIDTGFWGTCAAYASVYMEIAHDASLDWRLLFGPNGSPAEFEDESEENLTALVEQFSFPYEYTSSFSTDGGRLVAVTEQCRFEPDYYKRYDAEIDELRKIADEDETTG